MENVRELRITEVLKGLTKLSEEFLGLAGSEILSYEMIKGEVNGLRRVQATLIGENRACEEIIKDRKDTAKKIIEVAEEEASKVKSKANEILIEAIRLLEEVKPFAKDVLADKHARLKERSVVLGKAVASK